MSDHHHHHEMPTSGRALTGVAISATLHCLTGCALGEVTGVVIGTALGFSDAATIALAIALAFLFGYALTSLPLLRAGMAFATVVPIALASDTLSIATMEVVDNAILLVIPGAMEAGLGDLLFWGSLAFALAIAGVVAVPVNRYLIARGRGHAVVHETGIHGGPSPRTVGAIAAIAFVFGSVVLVAEAADGSDPAGAGAGADRAFAADMVPHHASALDMAAVAAARAETRFVRELAQDIVGSQTAEIAALRRADRRLAADGVETGSLGVPGHMTGMDMDTAELRTAEPFDRAFLEMMIPHHEGAVTMSQAELERGTDPALRRLARDIIAAQRREIVAMRAALAG